MNREELLAGAKEQNALIAKGRLPDDRKLQVLLYHIIDSLEEYSEETHEKGSAENCCCQSSESFNVSIRMEPDITDELKLMGGLESVVNWFKEQRNPNDPVDQRPITRAASWFFAKYGG